MIAWDFTSAKNWAAVFGFVSVPLYGRSRISGAAGEHSVLLDGRQSSLTLSHGNAKELLKSGRPIEWAWSANVPRSAIIDETTSLVYGVRWDRPEDIRELSNATPEAIGEMLRGLEEPSSASVTTSVDKALAVFRSVRNEVHTFGGTDLDAARAFSVLLVLADIMRHGNSASRTRTISEVATLPQFRRAGFENLTNVSPSISDFPIQDLATQLLEDHKGRLLDPYLLIRHASGTLFQDAHIVISQPVQKSPKLFVSLSSGPKKPVGHSPSDVHYTPTPLARFLTETAINEFRRLNPSATSIKILDPACGSGVFLVEAIREMEGKGISLEVHGVDTSEISKQMADFAVAFAADDFRAAGGSLSVSIECRDSLDQGWENPDVILMNPPFLPWRRLASKTRDKVKSSLGSSYEGKADTSIAFLAIAARELKSCGTMATVLPAAALKSDAALKLRKELSGAKWTVSMVGRIRGYGYFKNATVEPAFVVLRKTPPAGRLTRTLLAESEDADRAIRAARVSMPYVERLGNRWEIGTTESLDFVDWTPRPRAANKLTTKFLENASIRPVVDLFNIRLGIRTGENSVFVVPRSFVEKMEKPEREFFRPMADNIKHGRVQDPQFLFYPYKDGSLLLDNEVKLKTATPLFYATKLEPNRQLLEERKSIRDRWWWELVEPRTTWLTFGSPRIVSMTFGARGAFAFDNGGIYAVHQGNAWIWKDAATLSLNTWFSYLAILNSPLFEALLEHFCARTQGGQYELAHRFLEKVLLPDVTKMKDVRKLCEFGKAIHRGLRIPLANLDSAVASAYGTSVEEFLASFPYTQRTQSEVDFQRLASKWKQETEGMSSISQKMKHPAMKKILSMGEDAIPLILRDLKYKPNWWFLALTILSGVDPVPRGARGLLQETANAWLAWGKEKGYEL
jgi:hypothetical protein